KPITQNRLARMLKPLGIRPGKVGPEEARLNGYKLSQFKDAFDRYLGPEGASQPDNRTEGDEIRTSDISKVDSQDNGSPVPKSEKPINEGLLSPCPVAKGGAGKKTHVRTKVRRDEIKSTSSDPLYTGPQVPVPDLGPGPLDEPGQPVATSNGTAAPGLSRRRLQELADWYAAKPYYQYTPIDAGHLDGELRAILREEVFPEHIEIEFQRVKKAVWRGH